MSRAEIEASLAKRFASRSVKSALNHFTKLGGDFRAGDWEDATAKAGKFIEAVLKVLLEHCNLPVPKGKLFSVDGAINALGGTPKGAFDDAVRLQIPRAIRFIYDIASNRGARHDADEVDPNVMDATVSVSCCSWILAEMVRFSEKGAVDLEEAKRLIEGLTARTYPLIEDVDGRVYFHAKDRSARDVALVLLASKYPQRMSRDDLLAHLKRHRFKDANARMGITRLGRAIDDDGNGNLRLLQPGLQEAEEIMKEEQ